MAGVYDTNIPGTPQVLQANNLAKQAYQNSLARIQQKRNNTLSTAGYTGTFDANGGYTNLQVDPNNAGGGLQQMLRSQAQADESARFLGQERGLHGGLANQAETDLRYAHGNESAQFGRTLVDSLDTDIADQKTALSDYNNALYQAQLQATRDAIANQMFNYGDYGGDSGGNNDSSYTDYSAPASDNWWDIWNSSANPYQGTPGGTVKPKAKVAAKKVSKATGWTQIRRR